MVKHAETVNIYARMNEKDAKELSIQRTKNMHIASQISIFKLRHAYAHSLQSQVSKMADDDKLDSHKHRRKKAGTPEWSETCIGFWSKTYKEIPGKENEEQRRCRGISILHLNKVYDEIFDVNIVNISALLTI